jgi:4-diphosphocytidyl-2-C-methyl-D-erythritol kinase
MKPSAGAAIPQVIKVFAPAKVNLTLHVTGQREDGFHLLDSLACFPAIGDHLTFTGAPMMSLAIQNAPELLCDDTNLVMKAARQYLKSRPQAITLDKHLPIASGIGGGSADAAAVIRAAIALRTAMPPPETVLRLGADVSVCVPSVPSRMRGIGDILSPVEIWPQNVHILLVNPRVAVSTPAIFKSLTHKGNPPMPAELPQFNTLDRLVDFIAAQRNDLQGPAIAQQPIIADVLDAVSVTPGCLFARMSGSGATCFGIYEGAKEAVKASEEISAEHPNWWVDHGALQFY